MKERSVKIQQGCKLIPYNKRFKVNVGRIPTMLRAHSNRICKVPKCGSTYWTQAFLAMTGHVDIEHFEDVDREAIHGKLQEKIILRNWRPDSSNTLILVTRNPWQRIYSAYTDKIFRLQTSFVRDARAMVGESGKYSGKIPTFKQFLAFIISNYEKGRELDPHWRPISNLCRVCRYNYTYVLKMESFVEDSAYVLEEILHHNISAHKALFSFLSDKHGIDEVAKIVRQFTTEYRGLKRFVSFTDTMRRLWISLQSQGLISDDVTYNSDLFENLSPQNESLIVDMFNSKRNEKLLSNEERRQQRLKHFKEAYSKIDRKILDGIKKVYENDFLLFSYDTEI